MTEDAKERKRRRDRARYHRQKLLPGWNEKRIARNERSRQYAIANRERLEEYRRAWRKLNPEKLAAQRKRYRERVSCARSIFFSNGGGGAESMKPILLPMRNTDGSFESVMQRRSALHTGRD